MTIPLSQAKANSYYKIVSISGDEKQMRRLLDLGFCPKTMLKIVCVAPFGKTMLIELYGYMLALREEAAAQIEVEQVD